MTTPTYSPLAVANEFIALGAKEGRPIEHMKAQKLVHFVHGFSLAKNRALLNERPQVWKFGPVFKSLYEDLKYHGSDPIKEPESENFFGPVPRIDGDDKEASELIEKVWGKYKRYTGFQLSDLTHRRDTPWHKKVVELGGRVPFNTEIEDSLVKEHYLRMEL